MNTSKDLVAYLETYLTERRRSLFEQVLRERTNHFTVATEDVYQLHNTSAVIRSCDVFGIQHIHVIEEKNKKRIDREIAMGAQKWVTVHRHFSAKASIEQLRKKGYRIVATTPHHEASLLDDFDISRPAALFFGTEKNGLSDEVIQEADECLKIPMVGFTESLNISVSAAIILQNLTSRLKKSSCNWQLTAEEMIETKLSWTKNTIKSSEKIIEHYLSEKRKV